MAASSSTLDATLLLHDLKPRAAGATILSSTLNLCNTIMGTGILALPYALAGTGLYPGAAFLLLSTAAAIISLHLLSESARTVGRPASFYSVCEAAFPRLSIFADLIVISNGLLACLGFLIVAGDSFSKIIDGGPSRQIWILIALCFVTPLTFLRRMDMLKYTSFLSMCCYVLICAFVVAFALPSYTHLKAPPILQPCGEDQPITACRGHIEPIGPPLTMVRSFATFVISFTCQQNLFTVTNELRDPTTSRCLLVIVLAVSLALSFFVVVAYAGYLTFGDQVKSDILATYPQDNALVSAARVLLATVVITCFPLQAFAVRTSLGTLFSAAMRACGGGEDGSSSFIPTSSVVIERVVQRAVRATNGGGAPSAAAGGGGRLDAPAASPPPPTLLPSTGDDGDDDEDDEDDSGRGCICRVLDLKPKAVLISTIILCFATGVAMIVSKLGPVLDLNGSLAGTSITFIVPGLVWFLLHKHRRRSLMGGLSLLMLVLGVILVPTSLTAAFVHVDGPAPPNASSV